MSTRNRLKDHLVLDLSLPAISGRLPRNLLRTRQTLYSPGYYSQFPAINVSRISWARGCLFLLHTTCNTQSSSSVKLCFWSISSFKQLWRAALNSVLSLPLPHTTPLQRGALRGVGQCYWQQPRQRSIMWKAHGDTDLPSFLHWQWPTLSFPAFPSTSRGLCLPRRPNLHSERQSPPHNSFESQEVFKYVNPFMEVSITSVT